MEVKGGMSQWHGDGAEQVLLRRHSYFLPDIYYFLNPHSAGVRHWFLGICAAAYKA